MRKLKLLNEVHKELKEAGFEYLGDCIICDCYTHFWVKPIGDGKYKVAIADGWLGDYTPYFKEVDEEEVQRIKERIYEELHPRR
jgi:hypothetical protein